MKIDKINKRKWVCKSDITKEFLQKIGLQDYPVSFVKSFIDDCAVDDKFVKWFKTGNELNSKQVRHTKFVNANWLYRQLVKY